LRSRPFFEGDEKEAAVGVIDAAQHAVADDGRVVFDTRGFFEDVFRHSGDLIVTLQGGGIGKLECGENIALIFVWKEAGGNGFPQYAGQDSHPREQQQRDEAFMDEETADPDVTIRRAAEPFVEPIKEPLQEASALLFGPQ